MAFDFPNAPTTGQIYQPTGGPAWQYDGEKWKGGAIAGPQKEQFFDFTGKTQVDVTVPTWAKSCEVTIIILPTTTGTIYLRASEDGTTFRSGATDYTVSGPYHSSGSAGFATFGNTADNVLQLGVAADNTTTAQMVSADIQLVRAIASDAFTVKADHRTYHSAATNTHMRSWLHGWIGTTGWTSLTVKALRFIVTGGVARAGSHLHVRWRGDDAQIPTQNAIPDAPSDNGEYVRVNGVWRLKSQIYDITGKSSQDIVVPAWGPGSARLTIASTPGALGNIYMRLSVDGTTFPLGASDYGTGGFIHHTGTTSFASSGWTASSYITLAGSADLVAVPFAVIADIGLTRASNARPFFCMSRSMGYYNIAAGQFMTSMLSGCTNVAASFPGTGPIKVLRVMWQGGAVPDGRVNVEWLA